MTILEKMLYDRASLAKFDKTRKFYPWKHTDDYEQPLIQQKFKQFMIEIKNEKNKTIANLYSLVKNSEKQQLALTECIDQLFEASKSSLNYNLVENKIDPKSTIITPIHTSIAMKFVSDLKDLEVILALVKSEKMRTPYSDENRDKVFKIINPNYKEYPDEDPITQKQFGIFVNAVRIANAESLNQNYEKDGNYGK